MFFIPNFARWYAVEHPIDPPPIITASACSGTVDWNPPPFPL